MPCCPAASLPRPRNAYNLFTVDVVKRARAEKGEGEPLTRVSGVGVMALRGLQWWLRA